MSEEIILCDATAEQLFNSSVAELFNSGVCYDEPCDLDCGTRRRLPCQWVDHLKTKYRRADERAAWADVNCAWRARKQFVRGSKPKGKGIFCLEDIPELPDIERFTDINKNRDCRRP